MKAGRHIAPESWRVELGSYPNTVSRLDAMCKADGCYSRTPKKDSSAPVNPYCPIHQDKADS